MPRTRTLTEDREYVASLLSGRYVLGAQLGRGGAGVVYQAMDTSLGRAVAVKILRVTDVAASSRQLAEIRIMASVSGHPNIVSLFDAFIPDDDRPDGAFSGAVLVMELVDGPSLSEILRDGALPSGVVRRMGTEIASALVRLHANAIIHRDIKPANVLISSGGAAKLADFGISRLEGNTSLTATGFMIGTAGYLSPEQVRGQGAQLSSDIYAFGLVMLEALTGQREFPGPPTEAALARLTRDPIIPDVLSPELGQLLGAMLRRDPAERPTAADVLAALSAANLEARRPVPADAPAATTPIVRPGTVEAGNSAGTATMPMPRGAPRRGRALWLAVGVGILGVALVVLAIALVRGGSAPSTPEPVVSRSASPGDGSPAATVTAPTVTAPTVTAPTVTAPTVTAPTVTAPGTGSDSVVVSASAVVPALTTAATDPSANSPGPGKTKGNSSNAPGQTKSKNK
jgi:hypothetical protein